MNKASGSGSNVQLCCRLLVGTIYGTAGARLSARD
jgi:hypothetical protein